MADEERGEAASEVLAQFHSLVEVADRKFARVRDLPPTARGALHLLHCRKVFKAYTRLWQFQQHRRRELVAGGLRRWEIGDIASRIGQLYYGQYQRTSEVRFLLEAYVFYEAIVSRGYFEAARASAAPDLKLRYKELRFQARFFIVALLLNRTDEVRQLADRFRALVEESKAAFPATNFKEWKQVAQEISRVLRLRDALLASYRRNEIKFAELSLDTYRMVQCLEWEPSGSSYQLFRKEPYENGAFSDQSGASGLIDINLAADLMDPDLPPNPRKAVIYHPSVSQFIALTATICEELSSDSILLIYISASGKTDCSVASHKNVNGKSTNSSKANHARQASWKRDSSPSQPAIDDKLYPSTNPGSYLCLGAQGSNNLYPDDLVPFTRKPLFLIIDSDSSRAFKAETIAFCQLVGLSSDVEADIYVNAESLLSSALAEWEVTICTCNSLDRVWAQVLTDPFLRRLILRFIFCRTVLSLFCSSLDSAVHLPECIPKLPESLSPESAVTQTHIHHLAERLGVSNHFHFLDTIEDSDQSR
ncbi:hypothetical protein OPV22_023695 [Ensete ventricosum]|uniref:Protein SCAI n=1 Tax=Ensete ventricosum TaxID=4639 RepID=A0AAV8QXK7_ENSVE|nr:hypothetical protein OPV22_023695 [Ensete ventricosum]